MDSWPWKYFSQEEMRCRCGKCNGLPKPELMEKLESLRKDLGISLPVSSGYRCPEYNNIVSGTGLIGPHTTGLAVDLRIHGLKAFLVVSKAAEYLFTGIGIFQKGELNSRFIHLDCLDADMTRTRPALWSY